MSKKEEFIDYVENTLKNGNVMSENAKIYFDALKGGGDKEKPAFTENGRLILQFMRDNRETYNNLFKAKEVGEGLDITSKTASGSMRKLVTDGYLEKIGENPVVYSVTDKGIEANLTID